MSIVAQLLERTAKCGHTYSVPVGTRGPVRNFCDGCHPERNTGSGLVSALNVGNGNRACSGCGIEFEIIPRSSRKWCSRKCQDSHFRVNNPGARARASELAAKRYRESYVKPSHELVCAHCGESFTTSHKKKYCSRSCSNGAYAARRRADGRAADMSAKRKALELGVKIQAGRRLAVLEADNWICHLCDKPTNRDAVYPADDYPVIDHVVPLSKGGDHAPGNWKTAHSLCNMRKGDLSLEEYLERFPIKEVA